MRERVGASPWARRGALLGPRRRPRGNADRSARTTALSVRRSFRHARDELLAYRLAFDRRRRRVHPER
eukprot:30837-Pelagococcus_subviridis.AAC.1